MLEVAETKNTLSIPLIKYSKWCQSHSGHSAPNRNKHKADHLLNCLVVYEDFIIRVAELFVRTV